MVLYDKNRNPQLYDVEDLKKIIEAISNIRYSEGFIKASLGEKRIISDSANQFAKELIEDIKEYEEIVPEEIKKQFDISGLEKICKMILEK